MKIDKGDAIIIAIVVFIAVMVCALAIAVFQAQKEMDREISCVKSFLTKNKITIVYNAVIKSPSVEIYVQNDTAFLNQVRSLGADTVYVQYSQFWVFNKDMTIGYCWQP